MQRGAFPSASTRHPGEESILRSARLGNAKSFSVDRRDASSRAGVQIATAYLSSQTSSRRALSKMLFVFTISFLTQGRRQ